MCSGTEAGSYFRRIVSLSLRLKDLLGPVTRVKKKTAMGMLRQLAHRDQDDEEQ